MFAKGNQTLYGTLPGFVATQSVQRAADQARAALIDARQKADARHREMLLDEMDAEERAAFEERERQWKANLDAGRAAGDDGGPLWHWGDWIRDVLPGPFRSPLGDRHRRLWDHVDGVELGGYVFPRVEVWPRGSGKTTTAEAIAAFLGTTGRRKFVLYVRETQRQANASVQAIGEKLLSPGVERWMPMHATRAVNKFGISKGFSTNVLRTAGGFNVVALGLDAAGRGIKLDDFRPDAIIFDDIDGRHDSEAATKKKIETLTDSILPMGGNDTVVLFMQNLIIANGIVSRLTDGRADFLQDRIVAGPYPAVEGLTWEWQDREVPTAEGGTEVRKFAIITGGRATWEGQDLQACQRRIIQYGITSFLRECQHKVRDVEGALWHSGLIGANRIGPAQVPASFRYIAVGVDPSGSRKGSGDDTGIVVSGLAYDGTIITLADRSCPGDPDEWAREAVKAAVEFEADVIVAEKNFGGEMVRSVLKNAMHAMRSEPGGEDVPLFSIRLETASRGKIIRAEPVAQLMPEGEHKLLGGFPEMEDEMTTYVQGDPNSPNRLDALVWGVTYLLRKKAPAKKRGKRIRSQVQGTAH